MRPFNQVLCDENKIMNKYLLVLFLILQPLAVFADKYSDAWTLYNAGNYEPAMLVFSQLAKEGNIYSQAIVGIHHAAKNRHTEEKEPDPYSPKDVLSKITSKYNSKDVEAIFLLALMHDEGWAAKKDDAISKKLYLIASEAGHTAAQTHLAEYYELGIAGEKNKIKALFWYKKASEGGSAWAKHMFTQLNK